MAAPDDTPPNDDEAPLFDARSDVRFRLALGVAGCLAAGVVLACLVYVRTPYHTDALLTVDQPVEFDHRHHVQDDGIDCLFCHSTTTRTATAGMPSTALCMGCHNQIWNNAPLLEPVRRSFFSGEPIPWNRVNRLPGYVYFDHHAHTRAGVGCSSCHGRVDQMARVYQATSLSMGWCLDCHRNPGPSLRSPDRVTDMHWTAKSDPGRLTHVAISQRKLTDCVTCHR